MQRQYDVIIVGLGAMGAASSYHLARRGVRVLGLEQFEIPHAKGSSHGYSRMIRLAYFEHPDYVPLLRRSYELWDQLQQEFGQQLLFKTAGHYFGPPDGHVVRGMLRAAGQHGLAVIESPKHDLIRVPDSFVAVHEPDAGFLLPEKCIAAHALLAMHAGAELHAHEPVESWHADQASVRVTTRRGEYRARKLLF